MYNFFRLKVEITLFSHLGSPPKSLKTQLTTIFFFTTLRLARCECGPSEFITLSLTLTIYHFKVMICDTKVVLKLFCQPPSLKKTFSSTNL